MCVSLCLHTHTHTHTHVRVPLVLFLWRKLTNTKGDTQKKDKKAIWGSTFARSLLTRGEEGLPWWCSG